MMGLSNWIRSLINTFKETTSTYQLQFEGEDCMFNNLDELNKDNLLGDASILLTPNSFAEGELACVYPKPTNTPIVNMFNYTNLFYSGWTLTFTTVSTISLTNPFGGSNSALLAETASTGSHACAQLLTIINGVTYTFSVYLKKGNGASAPDIIQLYFTNNGFNSTLCANFNISTGVVVLQTGLTAIISDEGNGWWRCSITAAASSTSGSAGAGFCFVNNNGAAAKTPSYIGSINSNVYVYGGQLEIGSSVTTYQEIDTISPIVNNFAGFIKSSSLFTNRTNQLGIIQTIPWNLCNYSENGLYWALTSVTTISNSAISPIGTNNATRVIENTTTDNHSLYPGQVQIREAVPHTASIYLKKGIGSSAPDWIQLTLFASAVANAQRVNFNINTGEIGAFTPGSNPIIIDAGNGWWYCQATFIPAVITTNTNMLVAFINNNGNSARLPSYTGSTNSDFFMWGAQMVEGSSTLPYLPTTNRQNFPRLNYYDADPNIITSCANLLLENQATNLILNSDNFSLTWITSNLTVTASTELAPNNIQYGDTLTATSNDAYIRQSAGATSNNSSRVFSVFLKRKTGTGNISLQSGNVNQVVSIDSSWKRFWIVNNIMPGTYTSSGTSYTVTTTNPHGLTTGDAIRFDSTSGSAVDQNISSIVVTSTTQFTFTGTSVTTSGNCNIISNSGRINISVNGDEIYAWGSQLEVVITNVVTSNIIPTSYISTGSTSVTRSADNLVLKNPESSQVTFFVRIKKTGGTNSNGLPFIMFGDSASVATSRNSIHCSGVINGAILWYYKLNSGTVTSLATNAIYSPPESDYFSIIVTADNSATYKFNIWMDGSLIVSSTIAIDVSTLKYTLMGLSNPIVYLKQFTAWNRVLTKNEIDSLFAYPYYNAGYNPINSELQQVINRAYEEGFTIPSISTLSYCDTLITNVKNEGMWNISDVFYNFAYNDTNLSNFARINWKQPYGALGICNYIGSTVYELNGIRTTNTNTGYIDTRFNPSVANFNYSLNNASRLCVISARESGFYVDGVANNVRNQIQSGTSTGVVRINSTTGTAAVITILAQTGLVGVSRYDSTNISVFQRSTLQSTTQPVGVMENSTQYISRAGNFSFLTHAFYYMGSSVTNTQVQNFRTHYNTFLSNLGLTPVA